MLSTTTNRLATLLSDPFEAVRREFARDMDFVSNGNAATPRRYGGLALWEEDQKIHIEVDVPGMRIDDLNITMDSGQLWIRGERKFSHHEQKRWYDERFYGNFERSVALPDSIDPSAVEASLTDGVLSITVGKKPECQPYRVTIKSAGESESKKLTNDE